MTGLGGVGPKDGLGGVGPKDEQGGVGPTTARTAHGADTSLRRRLAMALLAAGLVLALALSATVWALLRVNDRQVAVTNLYYNAITSADRAFTRLVDAETAVRGYALTGDPVTLEPFSRLVEGTDEDNAPVPVTEEDLQAELGSGHRILEVRAEASGAALAWYEEFAEPTIAAVEAGGTAAVSAQDIERGRQLFDGVRVGAREYIDLLLEERAGAVADLRAATSVLRAVLIGLMTAAIAVGVLLWVFLRRWVTDPLAVLAADARIVAEGDVDHPVEGTGPGEVGEVARDVELMRVRLARLLAEAKERQAELEESHARMVEQAEDLRRSNRDLEQFAYVASHDLQEPLRKIASFTQLLAKRYEGQLDERADQYIGFAVDGAKRMQRLINDLLGFSRVGRIGGEVAPVALGDVLAQVVTDLQEPIEAAGAVVVGEDLPVVSGEQPLIVQLVTNLVANAVKFRHPDRAPVVRLDARRAGDLWEVACHDNGIGIDPQYAERVFVIFQRLHAKDVYEGTGIGLALCKKIVEYHGGAIWIEETASEGTTIRFTLPVTSPAVTTDTPAATDGRSAPEADLGAAGDDQADGTAPVAQTAVSGGKDRN